jgi:hypothetical protein
MTATALARPHRRSLWAFDRLNVFAADVRTGVGPYLAIYLQASRHWDPAQIGLAMSAMGLASIAAQTPVGGLAMPETQADKTMVRKTVPEAGAGQNVAEYDTP